MMVLDTICVHRTCNSQLVVSERKPVYCEVCNRAVRPEEIEVVDNAPSPFSG
jgi:hypothetical protein